MTRKITVLLLVIFGVASNGFAQQEPLYTQYLTQPAAVNPAVVGQLRVNTVTFDFKEQWAGFDGAPQTSILSYDGWTKNEKVGIGGLIVYDKLGPVTQFGVYGQYAYHLRFNEQNTEYLSLGLMGGFNYYQYDLLGLRSSGPDGLVSNDGNDARFLPNVGFGINYYLVDKFYVRFSLPKLIRNSLSSTDDSQATYGKEERHIFLSSAYRFKLDDDFDLEPSVFFRAVSGSPLSSDLMLTGIYKDQVYLSFMYRWKASIGGIIRWQINENIMIGYGYDASSNRLSSYNSGSHNFFISYSFKRKLGTSNYY